MTEARAHHFVPKCYLTNFANNEQVVAVDIKIGKRFVSHIKNVAQKRDFNRIESDQLPSDALEAAYGLFESELAPILKKLSEGGASLAHDHDDFSYILTLIGVLAVRNPRFRGNFSEFQDEMRYKMLALATATNERWEGQLAQARAAGYLDGVKDVPYEEIRASVERRDFKFVTTPHEHAQTELPAVDNLIENLSRRKWRWVRTTQNAGSFITCDHPVCLNWIERPKMRMPIGYGLTGTRVFFPISPDLGLLGDYDGRTDDFAADVFAFGDFNRRIISNADRQIYAKDENFQIFDGTKFLGVTDVLDRISSAGTNRDN